MKLVFGIFSLVFAFGAGAAEINLSCAVVAVGPAGNTVLEEGLGSIYDIDPEGYANADGDSTDGSILINGDKVELDLGQGSWSSKEDEITISKFTYDSEVTSEEAEGIDLEIKNTWGGTIYWRIFPDYKIATLSFTSADGDYKNSPLATLDCSGVTDIRNR